MRLREGALLIICAVLTTVVFAVTPLDIAAARIFYRPGTPDHWPLAAQFPWSALYRLAPAMTASLVLAATAWLIWSVVRGKQMWRRYAVFVLLSVVLGPGLLVNAVFKDHWDRPRPREVTQFNGLMNYVPAPLPGGGGGSFPCGHCSVGFLYALGFWIWRRRQPYLARVSLAAGILAGSVLGIGRMAAGAHFLSDVIWSALLAFAVAHALYYYVLRIPQHEASESVLQRAPAGPGSLRWSTIVAVASALAVLVALFGGPRGKLVSQTFCPSAGERPVRALAVTAQTTNIEVILSDVAPYSPLPCISVSGELHGFGLPTSRLSSGFRFDSALQTLHYRIDQTGWFTDLSGEVLIRLPALGLHRLTVQLNRGNIGIADLTRAGVVRHGLLQLNLRTECGKYQVPVLPGQDHLWESGGTSC